MKNLALAVAAVALFAGACSSSDEPSTQPGGSSASAPAAQGHR